jgi:2-dehydropantoate 2-reductase
MARVLVIGAGAVGCYFGVQLQGGGHAVTFLVRPGQAEALNRTPLRVQSQNKQDEVRLRTIVDPHAARDAELILLCVKSYDTASAAREIRPYLQPDARVVCVQNGVRNHEIFATEANHAAIPAVVYVAAQMESPTHLLVNAAGSLVIGVPRRRSDRLDELVKIFQSAHIPCRRSDFIERDLWEKLIINCAFNGISACTGAKYGAMMSSADVRDVMSEIIRESVAVACALGIPLEFEPVKSATWRVGENMPGALSSTAQDLQRGKRTEIEFLNGEIVQAGKRVGISTPINQAIVALVGLIEATR